jgi:hypothetical protein
MDPDRKLLVSSPSFLSDPTYAGEFEDYYRRDDRTVVFQSSSGNTIVIVENRSPNYPRRAYILLSRGAQGNWSHRELLLEAFLPAHKSDQSSPEFRGPLDFVYPEIFEVTDSHLGYSSIAGPLRVAIASLPAKG